MENATVKIIGTKAYFKDPYPHLARLRARTPVCYLDRFDGWFVTSYVDVMTALKDKRFKASRVEAYLDDTLNERQQGLLGGTTALIREWIIFMDEPVHGPRKSVLAKAFSATLPVIKKHIEAKAAHLIDDIHHTGQGDIIQDVACPLAGEVICQILGVPEEKRVIVASSSAALAPLVGRQPMSLAETIQAEAKVLHLVATMRDIIENKIRAPDNSLISQMLKHEDYPRDSCTLERIVADTTLLLFGGQDTSKYLIGNAIHALLQNHDRWLQLTAQPHLIASAVEEFLRFDSPVQTIARRVSETVELAGVTIPKGNRVMLSLGAANRDADRYQNPDTLDFNRRDVKHLSFGGGVHMCLGAVLARMELAAVLRRLTALQGSWHHKREPDFPSTITLRGPMSLQMELCNLPNKERIA